MNSDNDTVNLADDTPRIRDNTGTREQPLDPRGGRHGTRPLNMEPYEMTEGERDEAIYRQRLLDKDGRDSAYEFGLSNVKLPAPKGGWPVHTPREKLVV